MPLWRQKIASHEFGRYLLWELAKYGKGAEDALIQLLPGSVALLGADMALRESGVLGIQRHRYQMHFTAMMGELAFHSMREKRLAPLKVGFDSDIPALSKELAGILDCQESNLLSMKRFAELTSQRIVANTRFQKTTEIFDLRLNSPGGLDSPGGLVEELSIGVFKTSFSEKSVLWAGFRDPTKRSAYLMTLAMTVNSAFKWGAMFYKQYKLV